MAGGITFGAAKDSLRLVVDNGVGITDTRIMRRTNEATQELLAEIIPVNGMAGYNVMADANGIILLPKELENAIVAEPFGDGASVFGSTDTPRYFYELINPFTYVDPSVSHNNALIDNFLVPDPDDPTILRRQYKYPGLSNALVLVTGAKRYLPIASDADYLIIQNVPALKLMIQAIERRENLDIDNAVKYKSAAVELLQSEVKKHLLDANQWGRIKTDWEYDLSVFVRNTFGWVRARIALEVPGALKKGRDEIGRILERAELRLMECGIWKGCLEEFTAQVVCGHIVMPNRVESILAADLCGEPIDVRSIFFKYLENGPGDWDCSCGGRLEDEGDIVMNDGYRRHKYRLHTGGRTNGSQTTSSSSTDSGGSTSGDTVTAGSYLYIGDHARLVALANGMKLEVKEGDAWVDQGEWTE